MNNICSPLSKTKKGDKIGCLQKYDFKNVYNLFKEINQENKFLECNRNNNSYDLCILTKLKDKAHVLENQEKQYIEKLYEMYYKPEIPSEWIECDKPDKNQCLWLSNKHLCQIMNHYMHVYPNFLFLGVFLIDFYYHESKNLDGNIVLLDKLNFDSLNKDKINCCGMIFNTSKTGQPGEHWIALFFFWYKNRGEINYFDSYGRQKISPLPDYILRYMQMIQKSGLKYGINFVCQSNKIIHQKKDGECGMYCLYFLIYSMNNAFDMIKKRISDEQISKYRLEYWRKNN